MTRFALLARIAALCSTGAAIVHFGVAPEQFAEWWLYGLFFLLVGAFQLGWAFLVCTRPGTGLLACGLGVNATVAMLWAVTRMVGLPFVPEAWRPEPVGLADVVSTALELLVAVVCTWLLLAHDTPAPARVPRRFAAGVVGGLAAATLVVSGVALAAPAEHGTGTGHADVAGHDHAGHNGDRHELPNLPDVSTATPEQTAAARKLLDESITDTARYRDVRTATAAGYDVAAALRRRRRLRPETNGQKVIRALHVGKPSLHRDGRTADPAAPETLIYDRAADGTYRLVGVMYVMPKGQEGPDVAGPYTRWHYHVHGGHESTEMMHVWFVSDRDLRYAYALAPPRQQIAAYQATLH